jgi:hypothetical protein
MSLGKLLTTGKSLVGLSDGSRYKVRKGALPKFNSKKNPFAAKVATQQMLTPMEQAAAKLKETKRLPAVEAQPVSATAQPAAAKSELVTKILGMLRPALAKLNPLAWLPKRKPAEPKSAIPRFDKPGVVQGELSLDNIKVIRNDLSDADVEVVPMKARPAAKAAPALEAAPSVETAVNNVPELPPAKEPWEFLGERLLAKRD